MHRKLISIPIALIACMAGLASLEFAQSAKTAPQFETVSVKPNKSDDSGMMPRFGAELFSFTNVSLRNFVMNIYRLKDYQLVGTSGWMNNDKWDIVARTTDSTTMQEKYEMAKSVLAERFQLKFHWETRQLPIYLLVALKGGPKFNEPKPDEQEGLKISNGFLGGYKWDISTFAEILSGELNIPIVDKADLKGVRDFELKWSQLPNEANFTPTANNRTVPSTVDSSGPTIFTALQEQLGLKLEPSKGPVQVMVIDSVAKPSEN